MDGSRSIFRIAVEQLPESSVWLSRKSNVTPPKLPELLDMAKPLSAVNIVLMTALMRQLQLQSQNKSLVLPKDSVSTNLAHMAQQLGLDLVQAVSMRAAQTTIVRAAHKISPSHAVALFANPSTEAKQLWAEVTEAGDNSWSAKVAVAGRVFVISATTVTFQQFMMWSFGSIFAVIRRAAADYERRAIEDKATRARDRVARKVIQDKLTAHDEATPNWGRLGVRTVTGVARIGVIALCTATGAAAGTLVYPGAGTTALGLLGSVAGMVIF